MKENLLFKQSQLNYINNLKQKQKRTHKISNSLYWFPKSMVGFIVTFHLLSLLCQRTSSCWKYWKWCSYFENPYHHAKIVDKKTIVFLVSPFCMHLVVFQKIHFQVFWSSFVICLLQLPEQLHCDCAKISALKYCQYYSGYLLACQKRQ